MLLFPVRRKELLRREWLDQLSEFHMFFNRFGRYRSVDL
jgi:hypothetical protein